MSHVHGGRPVFCVLQKKAFLTPCGFRNAAFRRLERAEACANMELALTVGYFSLGKEGNQWQITSCLRNWKADGPAGLVLTFVSLCDNFRKIFQKGIDKCVSQDYTISKYY